MENKAKPRICEVLGVEVGQPFKAVTPHMIYDHLEIDQDGVVWDMGKSMPYKVGPRSLCYMINHPESIHKVHRWTPEEVELAKSIKSVWPEAVKLLRCNYLNTVELYNLYGLVYVFEAGRFPTLKPDETVLISDVIGGD